MRPHLTWVPLLAAWALLVACGRTPALPETPIRAGSDRELKQFRDELGTRFPAGELAAFDTALQEIRLEALNRDVSPAAAREDYLRQAINGKTVGEVTRRGWEARRTRFQAEMTYLRGLLEQDLARQQKTPTDNLASRISSAREVLARLERDLQATEAQLAALVDG
jgi:hypothetical protein